MRIQKLNLVLVLVGLIPASVFAEVIAGPIINPTNNHSYYLLSQSNWTSAETDASLLGGHLATINDQPENDWVWGTFAHYGGVSRYLWIGLHDYGSGWQWSDGEPVNYTNWCAGEGNQGASEPCTVDTPIRAKCLTIIWFRVNRMTGKILQTRVESLVLRSSA